MDSASTFIRRKKQPASASSSSGPGAFSAPGHQSSGTFFAPPSSYPSQAVPNQATRGVLTVPGPARVGGGGVARVRPTRVSDLPSLSTASRYEMHASRTAGIDTNRLADYHNTANAQLAFSGPPRPMAPNQQRPYRVPADTLRGRSAGNPNQGSRYPNQPISAQGRPAFGQTGPTQQSPMFPVADDAARARAALIDRERRQIFSYLSSPNTFLFSGVSGPVGLTEEDLDLLLAAGGTSTWTLLHLRVLDAAGKRFQGFEQLIPAVASLAAKQAEENRRVLTWLTGPACELFGEGDGTAVLLSMADVERLVIESQAGLDTLKHLQHLQTHGAQCETFQHLIHAVREAELNKNNPTSAGGDKRKSGADGKSGSNQAGKSSNAGKQQEEKQNDQQSGKDGNNDRSNDTNSLTPFGDVDSEERRLVLDWASSPNCTLFSAADAVVATASDLNDLISYCGNAALTVETLMQLDQNQVKFLSFSEILPTLKQLKSGGRGPQSLRPLLTQAQIEENRAIAHAYLSSPDCLLFSSQDSPVQATGRDFDDLVFAAGGDARECVRIMKKLDEGQGMRGDEEGARSFSAGQVVQQNGGMKFSSFAALIQAVSLTRSANLAADRAAGQMDEWTPDQREKVLAWLASPQCTLFSDLASGDVEVHMRELDTLMDLGGSHTLTWLQFYQQSVPMRRFESFARLTEAVRTSVQEMKAVIAPKLLSLLSKPQCPLWHASQANAKETALQAKGKGKGAKGAMSTRGAGGKSRALVSTGPGSGAVIAAKMTLQNVDELVYVSQACTDTPIHLDMLMREGRSFPSLPALIAAVKEAHEDKRNLAFVSDADRAAIVDFLSKENCVLFADEATQNDRTSSSSSKPSTAVSILASSHPGAPSFDSSLNSPTAAGAADIHVRKSDLDRLIVEGKGVNMCLFHLSALNASGRQFNSFSELLPAIREAHRQSVQEKLELHNKLVTHRAALFPQQASAREMYQRFQEQKDGGVHSHFTAEAIDSVVTEITQAQSDQLYIEGSAGGQTVHYIDIFLDCASTFASFEMLIEGVKELHSAVLRNRYATYLLERSEKLLSPSEKRSILLSYLYSQECTLFSEAEDVNVSDEDLDALQLEAGGLALGASSLAGSSATALAHTLLFLRYLSWSGRKFSSFPPLLSAVRDAFLASVRQKKAILDHLRMGVEKRGGGKDEQQGGAQQQQAGCRLLSSTAAQLQRTLDGRDVERLFVQGGAGPTTMSYLLDLEDQHLSFTSLDAIIHAVRLAHSQALETRQVEKNVLLAYLGSGACTLLASSSAAAGPASASTPYSATSSSSALRSVSDMELVTLLNVGKGGVSTLFFLQLLESTGRVCQTMADLISAVKEMREGYSLQRKKDIASFLKMERCNLLRDAERTPPNQATVDRLYVESGAGPTTLVHLWILNVNGHSFSSVESLIASIKLSHESSFSRGGSERNMLFAHLLGPLCGGVFPTMQGLPPVLWLKLNSEDIDQMIALCESGANAMRFLLALARAKKSFETWHALLDALHGLTEEMRAGRSQLLAKLSNADECSLFHTATPGQTSVDVHALTLADMDALTLRTQDARKTLFLLEAFESRRSRFASFADLVAAVGVAHFNTMASIRTEKSLIYLHLTAPSCTLLSASQSPGFTILDPELDALFLVAGSAKGTLFLLNQLEGHHKTYATMQSLIEDVTKLHAESAEVKKEVLAFFQHPAHKLLQPKSAHLNNGSGDVSSHQPSVTAQDVERLYAESGAGVELLPLLWSLESQGLRFVSMAQVIASVRAAALRSSQQAKEDRLVVLSFLSRPECRLFKGPVAAKPRDIDALLAAGGGPLPHAPAASNQAAATLELLRELDANPHDNGSDQPKGVETFQSLINAVANLRSAHQAQRAAVLAFLTSPRCFLFKDAPMDITLDAAAVEQLFQRGGAGKDTLEHIKALGVAGGRFGSFFSFNELIDAVRALHLQAIQQEQGYKRLGEEEKDAGPSPLSPASRNYLASPKSKSAAIPSNFPYPASAPPPSNSPAGVLAFLQSPNRRFFQKNSGVHVGERELDALLQVSESASSLLRHLEDLELGSSAEFHTFGELIGAVQHAEAKSLAEKKAIQAFLASTKCRLLRVPQAAGSSETEEQQSIHVTEQEMDELFARGCAGSFTLHHLQRLNDENVHAESFSHLVQLVRDAHAAAEATLRSQKQLLRTYLASFHSSLLWSQPHGAPANVPQQRMKLTDSDLTHLLLEAGGSAPSLMRHLHKLDETRVHAAATHPPGSAQRKSYHSVADLAHAVRDLSHHELHTKRDLLEYLNSPSCKLWDDSVPAHSHASIHDVDRLFDGTHAHFDTPLFLWLFRHSGRKFHSCSQLIEAVRDARREFEVGSAAEVLTLVAHLSSPAFTLLPDSDSPCSLASLVHLLQLGGGGSATLFELCQLEARGFVARDWEHLEAEVQKGAAGTTMRVKSEVLAYLADQSRLFSLNAPRIEAVFPGSLSHTTDSLAQLPVTSAGVSRMVEEGGHGLQTLTALKQLDRSRYVCADLRSAVSALLDGHGNAARHDELIAAKRARALSEKLAPRSSPAPHSSASPAPQAAAKEKEASQWSEAERTEIVQFLSNPDTLLFSETSNQLEVSARLLDTLLNATLGPNGQPVSSTQEALVLLRHLNLSARKLADLPELVTAVEKEHVFLLQCALEVYARLQEEHCTLWAAGKRPDLSHEIVLKQLLLDTHAACHAPQRLDELELSQQTFTSISQLAAAIADEQQQYFSRLASSKEHLIGHLSTPEVAERLFSCAVNMNDVDLHALLIAGRAGGTNVTDAIDAARADGKRFSSVPEMLAFVRAFTSEHEKDLMEYLLSTAGRSLLANPDATLAFLSSHLLTCLPFIYGSADVGANVVENAKMLVAAGCVFSNAHKLVMALRRPSEAIRALETHQAGLKSDADAWGIQAAGGETVEDVGGPNADDVEALVSYLQELSTLLFADSAEDLSIETEDISKLFAASVPADQPGSFDATAPHVRAMNQVHRRFERFTDLAPAITQALQPENKGAYASDEQLSMIRMTIHASKAKKLFATVPNDVGASDESRMREAGVVVRDQESKVIVSRRQADRLLKLIPVNPDAFSSGLIELLEHLRAFGLAQRQFKDWSALSTTLTHVVQNPSVGHLSDADAKAIHAFFTGVPTPYVLAEGVPPPSMVQMDDLVSASGGLETLWDFLSKMNDLKTRCTSIRLLVDEITDMRQAMPASSRASMRGTPMPAATPAPAEPSRDQPVIDTTHTRHYSTAVSTVSSASAASSRPASATNAAPLIPHISDEDQQRLAQYLSESLLFSEATSPLEITVESLDQLAFECGSVPDLMDLLKQLDKSGARFLTFFDLVVRIRERVKSQADGPVGEEPKPVERKPSTPRAHSSIPPYSSLADASLTTTTVVAPPAVWTLTEAERERFVGWLGSLGCSFFLDAGDLNVTVEELDAIAHAGGGLEKTLIVLTHLSRNGLRLQAFNQVLPALLAEMANPTPAKPIEPVVVAPAVATTIPAAAPVSPTASQSSFTATTHTTTTTTHTIIPLMDDERDEVVGFLGDCALFEEATENLEIEAEDLDEMRYWAGSVANLLAGLRDLDAQRARPKTFKELFTLVKQYWATKGKSTDAATASTTTTITTAHTTETAAPAAAASLPIASTPAAATSTPIAAAAPATSTTAAAAAPAVVEPTPAPAPHAAPAALTQPAPSTAAASAPAASAPPAATAAPVAASPAPPAVAAASPPAEAVDPQQQLVDYISAEECLLFSEASENLSVEPAAIDALIAAAGGIQPLLTALRGLDSVYRRFNTFEELQPAVSEALSSNCHIGDSASGQLVGYLSGEADPCELFSQAADALEVSVEELDALVTAGRGIRSTLAALKELDRAGRKFQRFAELAPAVREHLAKAAPAESV